MPPRANKYSENDEPIKGYTLLDFLGRGQYGEVWKAQETATGKQVALKIIDLSHSPSALKELRALNMIKNLNHPHLVPIFTARLKDHNGQEVELKKAEELKQKGKLRELIIAMQLAEKSLGNRLKEINPDGTPPDLHHGLPPEELLSYMMGAAKGIDYLNRDEHGGVSGPIVHCDIKPDNMMIVSGEVQIADCGVAIIIQEDARQTKAAGSPAYSAPELTGNKPVPGTDQYALAISYYELRTGRLPFDESEGQFAIMLAHAEGRLEWNSPILTPSERQVLKWATARQPKDRYPSCVDMVKQLQRAVDGLPVLEPSKLITQRNSPSQTSLPSSTLDLKVGSKADLRSTPGSTGSGPMPSMPFMSNNDEPSMPFLPNVGEPSGLRATGSIDFNPVALESGDYQPMMDRLRETTNPNDSTPTNTPTDGDPRQTLNPAAELRGTSPRRKVPVDPDDPLGDAVSMMSQYGSLPPPSPMLPPLSKSLPFVPPPPRSPIRPVPRSQPVIGLPPAEPSTTTAPQADDIELPQWARQAAEASNPNLIRQSGVPAAVPPSKEPPSKTLLIIGGIVVLAVIGVGVGLLTTGLLNPKPAPLTSDTGKVVVPPPPPPPSTKQGDTGPTPPTDPFAVLLAELEGTKPEKLKDEVIKAFGTFPLRHQELILALVKRGVADPATRSPILEGLSVQDGWIGNTVKSDRPTVREWQSPSLQANLDAFRSRLAGLSASTDPTPDALSDITKGITTLREGLNRAGEPFHEDWTKSQELPTVALATQSLLASAESWTEASKATRSRTGNTTNPEIPAKLTKLADAITKAADGSAADQIPFAVDYLRLQLIRKKFDDATLKEAKSVRDRMVSLEKSLPNGVTLEPVREAYKRLLRESIKQLSKTGQWPKLRDLANEDVLARIVVVDQDLNTTAKPVLDLDNVKADSDDVAAYLKFVRGRLAGSAAQIGEGWKTMPIELQRDASQKSVCKWLLVQFQELPLTAEGNKLKLGNADVAPLVELVSALKPSPDTADESPNTAKAWLRYDLAKSDGVPVSVSSPWALTEWLEQHLVAIDKDGIDKKTPLADRLQRKRDAQQAVSKQLETWQSAVSKANTKPEVTKNLTAAQVRLVASNPTEFKDQFKPTWTSAVRFNDQFSPEQIAYLALLAQVRLVDEFGTRAIYDDNLIPEAVQLWIDAQKYASMALNRENKQPVARLVRARLALFVFKYMFFERARKILPINEQAQKNAPTVSFVDPQRQSASTIFQQIDQDYTEAALTPRAAEITYEHATAKSYQLLTLGYRGGLSRTDLTTVCQRTRELGLRALAEGHPAPERLHQVLGQTAEWAAWLANIDADKNYFDADKHYQQALELVDTSTPEGRLLKAKLLLERGRSEYRAVVFGESKRASLASAIDRLRASVRDYEALGQAKSVDHVEALYHLGMATVANGKDGQPELEAAFTANAIPGSGRALNGWNFMTWYYARDKDDKKPAIETLNRCVNLLGPKVRIEFELEQSPTFLTALAEILDTDDKTYKLGAGRLDNIVLPALRKFTEKTPVSAGGVKLEASAMYQQTMAALVSCWLNEAGTLSVDEQKEEARKFEKAMSDYPWILPANVRKRASEQVKKLLK